MRPHRRPHGLPPLGIPAPRLLPGPAGPRPAHHPPQAFAVNQAQNQNLFQTREESRMRGPQGCAWEQGRRRKGLHRRAETPAGEGRQEALAQARALAPTPSRPSPRLASDDGAAPARETPQEKMAPTAPPLPAHHPTAAPAPCTTLGARRPWHGQSESPRAGVAHSFGPPTAAALAPRLPPEDKALGDGARARELQAGRGAPPPTPPRAQCRCWGAQTRPSPCHHTLRRLGPGSCDGPSPFGASRCACCCGESERPELRLPGRWWGGAGGGARGGVAGGRPGGAQ